MLPCTHGERGWEGASERASEGRVGRKGAYVRRWVVALDTFQVRQLALPGDGDPGLALERQVAILPPDHYDLAVDHAHRGSGLGVPRRVGFRGRRDRRLCENNSENNSEKAWPVHANAAPCLCRRCNLHHAQSQHNVGRAVQSRSRADPIPAVQGCPEQIPSRLTELLTSIGTSGHRDIGRWRSQGVGEPGGGAMCTRFSAMEGIWSHCWVLVSYTRQSRWNVPVSQGSGAGVRVGVQGLLGQS